MAMEPKLYDTATVAKLTETVIRPSFPTERRQLFLPGLDMFWQEYYRRVIFYRIHPAETYPNFVNRLKQSLSEVLVHYYPWSGRIAIDSQNRKRFSIDCNDAGVPFTEAETSLAMAELEDNGFQMSPLYDRLCPTLELSSPSSSTDGDGNLICLDERLFTNPILSVQVTRFRDGGAAVGTVQNHMVADGTTFWNLMVAWGECARSVPVKLQALHSREALAVRNPSPEKARINFWFEENVNIVKQRRSREELAAFECIRNKYLAQCVFKVSKSCIQKLKFQAASEIQNSVNVNYAHNSAEPLESQSPNPSSESESAKIKCKNSVNSNIYSAFIVVSAHFWQRITAARQQEGPDEPVHFCMAVNCRSIDPIRELIKSEASYYAGNAIMFAGSTADAASLRHEPLKVTAERLRRAVQSSREEGALEAYMHWLELHNNEVDCAFKGLVRGWGMNSASSHRFPAYETDFGWGPPLAVRSAKVLGDGEMVFFPAPPASEAELHICMALPPLVMRRLLDDPMFLAKPCCQVD